MNSFGLSILTAVVWGCVPIIEKFGLVKLDPLMGLFYRCLGVLGGIVLLLVFKSADVKNSLSQLHVGMVYLMIGGFLASVVGQIFFYQALKSGEASRVVPLAATYPLVTFILGLIFWGEKVTLAKCGGIGFVVLGIFLLK